MEKEHFYSSVNHYDVNHADAATWVDKNGNKFELTNQEDKFGFLLKVNGGGNAKAVQVVNNNGTIFLKNKQGEIWSYTGLGWNKQGTTQLPADTGSILQASSGNTGIAAGQIKPDQQLTPSSPATAGSPTILAPNVDGGIKTSVPTPVFDQVFKAVTGIVPGLDLQPNTSATPTASGPVATASFQLSTPMIMIGMASVVLILLVVFHHKKKGK